MKNQELAHALRFVAWYRHMVIEGQITATEYALARKPVGDFELMQELQALADLAKRQEERLRDSQVSR